MSLSGMRGQLRCIQTDSGLWPDTITKIEKSWGFSWNLKKKQVIDQLFQWKWLTPTLDACSCSRFCSNFNNRLFLHGSAKPFYLHFVSFFLLIFQQERQRWMLKDEDGIVSIRVRYETSYVWTGSGLFFTHFQWA